MDRLLAIVDRVSPLRLAADWDAVGLLIGRRAAKVERLLLTIDLTEAVLDEASSLGPGKSTTAIVAYHPPIFDPIKRLSDDDPRGAMLLRAARELAGVVTPHTALDAVAGGLCDWLAEGIGEGVLAPIEPAHEQPSGEAVLVVTKLPRDAAARVRDAMGLAGAGRIGAYSRCAFETTGMGSFEGDASTNPRVGRRERLERVEESKLEMVSSKAVLARVLAALRAAHPYEEPPIEVIPLAARPSVREGHGRVIELLQPASTAEIVRRVARHLGLRADDLEVVESAAMPPGRDSRGSRLKRGAVHRRIGLCPGSGGSLLRRAVEMGGTLFVTGEMKHHERLDAAARGCTVTLAGHTETERPYLRRYRERLRRELPGLSIEIARSDRPPSD